MHLRKYPFDSQSCPLELGSFSYTARDVVFRWADTPVSMTNLQMAQYKLTSLDHGVRNENSTRSGEPLQILSIQLVCFAEKSPRG